MHSTFIIRGTHCPSCKALIEDVASETPAISSCTVDYTTGQTKIEHDDSVDWDTFTKEVESLGDYKVIR